MLVFHSQSDAHARTARTNIRGAIPTPPISPCHFSIIPFSGCAELQKKIFLPTAKPPRKNKIKGTSLVLNEKKSASVSHNAPKRTPACQRQVSSAELSLLLFNFLFETPTVCPRRTTRTNDDDTAVLLYYHTCTYHTRT